jgi:hypothetical protein
MLLLPLLLLLLLSTHRGHKPKMLISFHQFRSHVERSWNQFRCDLGSNATAAAAAAAAAARHVVATLLIDLLVLLLL